MKQPLVSVGRFNQYHYRNKQREGIVRMKISLFHQNKSPNFLLSGFANPRGRKESPGNKLASRKKKAARKDENISRGRNLVREGKSATKKKREGSRKWRKRSLKKYDKTFFMLKEGLGLRRTLFSHYKKCFSQFILRLSQSVLGVNAIGALIHQEREREICIRRVCRRWGKL